MATFRAIKRTHEEESRDHPANRARIEPELELYSASTGSLKKYINVPDNNHTTQENTGGVWLFIVATPKHQVVVSNHTKIRVE